MKTAVRMLPLSLAALLLAGAFVAAEEGATLTGTVVSSNGAGLSGALLTVTHRETGQTRTTGSGDRGLYRFGGLAGGSYTVTVELPGFAATSLGVTLAAAQAGTLNIILSPSGFQEKVTVTAASPRDTLEAADVRRSAARDVGEALSALPGLWMLRKGGIANDVVVRGLQSKDLSILIDGERIYGACPNHMDPPAFHVDFAEVDRIEVNKGPFDVKNSGSLGGVVNVVTRPPEPGWHTTPYLAGGSWDFVNPSAVVSYGGTRLSGMGGVSYRTSKPFEDGSGLLFTDPARFTASPTAAYESDAMENDAFNVGTLWGKMGFELQEGHSMTVSYTRQEADDVYYPYLQMDAIYDNTDRAKIGYEMTREDSALKGLKTQVYFTRVDHWMTDEYRLSSTGRPRDYSMGTQALARTLGGRAEARMARVTFGLEGYRREWDATTRMAGSMNTYAPQRGLPGAITDLAGLYVEGEQPITERWKLTAGARVDRASSSVDENPASMDLYYAYNDTRSTSRTDTLPSASFRFTFKEESWELSAGAGRTARVPEPNERYYSLKRMGSDWVGNPELDPGLNTGADISATLSRPRLHLSGSLFGNLLGDNITVVNRTRQNTVPGVMNTAARSYANTDAKLYGAEVSMVATLPGHLFLSGDASYVRGRQDADYEKGILSENMAETPPQRFRAALRYDTGKWWTEGEGVFSGPQTHVAADLREEPTPAWEIANVRGGVQRGALSLTAGVTNLFDREYHEHLSYQRDPFRSGVVVYEPGRSFFINAGYRF